jgi:serine/threonine-protein kinase
MLEPGQTFDRYTVEKTLGEGGMASVYQVRHTTLGSLHALKVLHVHGAAIRERLLAEGRVQAGLDHPNALVVTDVIDVDGSPGLVMEYVDGGSLEEWIQPSVSREQRLEVFRSVCDAVASAHEAGWIHRDLKPANVLVKRVGTKVVPKVADFGLVKTLRGQQPHDGPATRDGATMGSPGYMAPEQIENAADVDARADVYSLGCLLHWVLTGERAFKGDTVLEIFQEVGAGRHRRLPSGDPLQPVVDRCLSLKAADRYPDAGALRGALQPEALAPRPKQRVSLAPLVVLGGVVVLGALVGVLIVAVSVATLASGSGSASPIATSGCPTTDDVGWVRGTASRATPIPNPYELAEPTDVLERANSKSEVVCQLPAGTRLSWTSRYRRPLREVFYVQVKADEVNVP